MRALAVVLAVSAGLVTPAFAQSQPAAPAAATPRTKRVCRFVDTGNPLNLERRCREVPIKDQATATSAPATPTPAAVDQVAMQSPPQR